MIGQFSFNGTDSSEFSLVCKSIKRPLLPAMKVSRVESIGVSGSYDFDVNEYQLRSVTMRITYIGTSYEELRSRAREIAAWLTVSTWSQLIINDEPDKYYLAKVTSQIDLNSMYEAGEIDVVFDCQPFAYSLYDETEMYDGIVTTTEVPFTNPGTRKIDYKSPEGSTSYIYVTGTWTTLTLAMNGKSITYNHAESSKTVRFDNIELEVEMTGGVNKFQYLTGDVTTFLTILPGENVLTVSGTDIEVDIVINYIPLWI